MDDAKIYRGPSVYVTICVNTLLYKTTFKSRCSVLELKANIAFK